MAKHRKHRRRRSMKGIIRVPGLGFLKDNVNVQDVAIGALIGVGATAIIKVVMNSDALKNVVPAMVRDNAPLVGPVIAAGALYYLQKSKNRARAVGHAVGAAFAGAAAFGWNKLQTNYPQYFADMVQVRMAGHAASMGLLVDSRRRALPGMSGVIVSDTMASRSNLSRLASMEGEDDAD